MYPIFILRNCMREVERSTSIPNDIVCFPKVDFLTLFQGGGQKYYGDCYLEI